MLINFSVNSDNKFKLRDIAYAIHFLLLKKDERLEEGKLITLQSFFGSKHIDQLNIKDEYFLIFLGGLYPNGFYMKFFAKKLQYDYNIYFDTTLKLFNFSTTHRDIDIIFSHSDIQEGKLWGN